MLINPYDLEKGISDDFNKEDINIEEIQKNIILKYNKELNNEKKEKLIEKIKLLLINNYKASFLNALKNDIKEDLREHHLEIKEVVLPENEENNAI